MAKLREHIKVIFAIFARDMKRLVRNPIAILIVLGSCVLPALYAWYTIAAFWDPYQNTDDIKVAVVDQDVGASSKLTGEIDIGKEVVDDLSTNHQLGWQIVDEQEAMDGVYSGQYYAAIIMPEDFSKSFLSVLDGHFERPEIEFYVNDKLTGSGVKVAEAGGTTLEKTINEDFVSTVSKKVVTIIQKADSDVLTDTDDASGSLTKGVHDADEAIKSTIETLENLAPTLDDASTTVGDGQNALKQVKDDLPTLETELGSAKQQLGVVRTSLDSYSSNVSQQISKAAVDMGTAAAKTSQAAGQISGKIDNALGEVNAAISDVQRVSKLNSEMLADLKEQEAAGITGLTGAISDLQQENESLSKTLTSLQNMSSALGSATTSTDSAIQHISNAVESSMKALSESTSKVETGVIPKVNESLNDIADAIGTIHGALVSLTPVLEECITVTGDLQDAIARSKSICESAKTTLEVTEKNIGNSLTDLHALQNSATYKLLKDYLGISDDKFATFLAEPVDMKTNDIYPVSNYGSGVAPFFSNLALWVAGFILMAIVRIRIDPTGLPKFTRIEGYFGRWLTYIFFGIIQGAVICIGDLLIGVECVNPVAFVGAGVLTAFVYVNLMYALAYSMRHVGKAIAVFLLILQIPGSSGMFPVEMLPSFYQALNPFLPFTYSINAMREALAGFYQFDYLKDMLMLFLVFAPIGFIVGLVVGKYGYNLNILFDRKLGQTGLFMSEDSEGLKPAFRLRTMVKALLNTTQYRQYIIERAKRFDRNYKKLARIGWSALFIMPILMIVCISVFNKSPDVKLIMLAWFFLGLVAVAAYLICISFLNSDIRFQTSLANKDDADLKSAIDASSDTDKMTNSLGDVTDKPFRILESAGKTKNQPTMASSYETDDSEDSLKQDAVSINSGIFDDELDTPEESGGEKK